MALRLLGEHGDVLEHWRERCRHILVDEFQDTNAVQYRIVSLLAGATGNLTVVGRRRPVDLRLARGAAGQHPRLHPRMAGGDR